MKLKLRNTNIDLKLYGFATEVHYEKKYHKALDPNNLTATSIVELFYCVTIANLEREKKDIITFEEFFDDVYDLNEGDVTILKFYKWYLKQRIAQNELLSKVVEEDEVDEQPKN